jgi:hypothetical protein
MMTPTKSYQPRNPTGEHVKFWAGWIVVIAIVIVLFALGGCGGGNTKPDETPLTASVKVVEVPKPYPVPCIDANDVPILPLVTPGMDDPTIDPEQRNAAIILYAEAMKRYGKGTDVLIQQCVKGDVSNVQIPATTVPVK